MARETGAGQETAGESNRKIFQDWLAAYGNHLNKMARHELPDKDDLPQHAPGR
jgi:hypothetical protein